MSSERTLTVTGIPIVYGLVPSSPPPTLRLVMGELQVADVRNQVALSLDTDFENGRVFKPHPRNEKLANDMLDQVIAWGSALKTLREKIV